MKMIQTIGVLGLQGGYKAHAQMLEALGHNTLESVTPMSSLSSPASFYRAARARLNCG